MLPLRTNERPLLKNGPLALSPKTLKQGTGQGTAKSACPVFFSGENWEAGLGAFPRFPKGKRAAAFCGARGNAVGNPASGRFTTEAPAEIQIESLPPRGSEGEGGRAAAGWGSIAAAGWGGGRRRSPPHGEFSYSLTHGGKVRYGGHIRDGIAQASRRARGGRRR